MPHRETAAVALDLARRSCLWRSFASSTATRSALGALLRDLVACGLWRRSEPPELPEIGLERLHPTSRLSWPR